MAYDNLFDPLQGSAFDTVALVMGYNAFWYPVSGTGLITARVLFKNPTDSQKLGDQEYDPYRYTMEYQKGCFPGLKESIDANNEEQVIIREAVYYVRKVNAKFDGGTLVAILDLKE